MENSPNPRRSAAKRPAQGQSYPKSSRRPATNQPPAGGDGAEKRGESARNRRGDHAPQGDNRAAGGRRYGTSSRGPDARSRGPASRNPATGEFPAHETSNAKSVRQRRAQIDSGSEVQRRLALYSPEMLSPRPLTADKIPVIVARSPSRHPYYFRKMLVSGIKAAQPGDLVKVILEESQQTLGYGLYNPRAEMTVRMLTRGDQIPDEAWWKAKLEAAVKFRTETLGLDQQGNVYRLVHAEGDGLPGLMVDRYGDVLSVEAFNLGMYQRAESILDLLAACTGAKHGILRPGAYAAQLEGFDADPFGSENAPESVQVVENGVKYEVQFEDGHKTGFFCDQRQNRARVAELAAGQRVLDLCCYSGGFALSAAVAGAKSVHGVDLDEAAIAVAKKNAKLNKVQIEWAHADIFAWMREAQKQGQQWDIVVLDPPKLIRTRDDYEDGRKKYFDMNRLAASLVAPGGMLITCSCSGLLSSADFTRVTGYAIDNAGRSARLCEQTGAGPDHPVHVRCPESLYLKVNWYWFDEAPVTKSAHLPEDLMEDFTGESDSLTDADD